VPEKTNKQASASRVLFMVIPPWKA